MPVLMFLNGQEHTVSRVRLQIKCARNLQRCLQLTIGEINARKIVCMSCGILVTFLLFFAPKYSLLASDWLNKTKNV